MTARNPDDNVLRFRVQSQSLSNLDALARDLGVSRQDAARVALGVGMLGLRQVKDAAALHAAPDLAPLYDIFYRLNRAALTGKVGDAVAGDIYTLGELLRSWGNSPGSNAESCPPPPAPTRLQQAVAAYRKLLDNRLRDHDAEYRARCEIADAALAEAQESEE